MLYWKTGICSLAALLLAGCLNTPPAVDDGDSATSGDQQSEATQSTDQPGEYWLRAMTINTEWLWNSDADIDGIVRDAGDLPTPIEYMAEINYFANLIAQSDANLVALQEIEGCYVIDAIISELEAGTWYSVCATGRDTFTGQDVGIVSQFPIRFGPTTFSDIWGEYDGASARPSKVVGAVLETPQGGIAVIATHLLSKLNPANDGKRAAQADAISTGFTELYTRAGVQHGLVMGDLNDTQDSVPLTLLTGSGVLSNTLYANGRAPTAADCTYTYGGECSLIDHILVSGSLSGGSFQVIDANDAYTDHDTVLFRAPVP